jgi:acetylornithine deacetylase/succinyl-diaminopimelate desuccinylase-like protein
MNRRSVVTDSQEMEPRRLARDVFQELIEIDTTRTSGSTTAAAEMVAQRLLQAGFAEGDVHVIGPHPRKGNLVARLRGTGTGRPILLLAHLDVVDASREEWTVDPFTFLERDAHFYGRGTTDDKAMAAIWIANLIRLRQQDFMPQRDIILALTADEEGGEHNGAEWLLREYPDLVDAEYGLNEGGYGRTKSGKRIANTIQASEKISLDFLLEANGRSGHSSLPLPDSAVRTLAEGISRLATFEFPVRLGEVTRAFFTQMAEIEAGQIAADMQSVLRSPPDPEAFSRLSAIPYYNGLLRTTCAVTRLEAGEGGNTIPATARAVVNCRILPDEPPAQVERALAAALADERIEVRALGAVEPSPPSPLTTEILQPVQQITADLWPGVPVVPVMSIGGTDSRHFRRAGIPMYGVSGIFLDVDDVRAHGPDERIGVQAFYEGQEFLYRLVRTLAQSTASVAAGREV